MDENKFFREATIAICGNLEIEKALFLCLQVLRKVMPVDRMYLQHFDPGYNSMRTIAAATVSNSSILDLLTPLSEEARASAKRQDLPLEQEVFIFDDPQKTFTHTLILPIFCERFFLLFLEYLSVFIHYAGGRPD